jgi:hypothetical protein
MRGDFDTTEAIGDLTGLAPDYSKSSNLRGSGIRFGDGWLKQAVAGSAYSMRSSFSTKLSLC